MTWTLMVPPGLFCSHKLTLLSSARIKAILKLVKKMFLTFNTQVQAI